MLKINWDVAVDKGSGRIGIGIIIVRDHEGIVLAARSMTKNFLVDSTATETLAALCALDFSREMFIYTNVYIYIILE